jgi:hypothetical protein
LQLFLEEVPEQGLTTMRVSCWKLHVSCFQIQDRNRSSFSLSQVEKNETICAVHSNRWELRKILLAPIWFACSWKPTRNSERIPPISSKRRECPWCWSISIQIEDNPNVKTNIQETGFVSSDLWGFIYVCTAKITS